MNFKAVLIISILNILYEYTSSSVPQNWIELSQHLKNDIRKWYKKKFPSLNDSISIGHRPLGILDYPKNDKKKLEILNRIWDKYYSCLQAREESALEDRTMPPYTIAAFTDSSIQMECNICISPEDVLQEVEWYFTNKPSRFQSVLVEEDEHKQISAYTLSLHLHSVQTYHQGMYYCNFTTDIDAPYFLHVFSSGSEPFRQVKTKNAKTGPFPRDPLRIKGTNIILWNEWTEWTECNWCKKVGKRTKIGFCKISLLQNLPSEVKSQINSTSGNQMLDVSRTIIQETEELLTTFYYGIPCRSALLPWEIRNSKTVKTFFTEIQTGFCKVACPSDVVVEVLDKDSKVVETYNNTAGEYYSQQELPPLREGPIRATMYADPGKPFVLPCPSKLEQNSPVEWSVGGKIWLKDTVESISQNRITINELNEIVFNKVEEVDSKIYSCWQERRLVAVIRLNLTEVPSFIEEYLLTLELYPVFMFTAIILTFILVLIRMFLNREKAKIAAIGSRKKNFNLLNSQKDIS